MDKKLPKNKKKYRLYHELKKWDGASDQEYEATKVLYESLVNAGYLENVIAISYGPSIVSNWPRISINIKEIDNDKKDIASFFVYPYSRKRVNYKYKGKRYTNKKRHSTSPTCEYSFFYFDNKSDPNWVLANTKKILNKFPSLDEIEEEYALALNSLSKEEKPHLIQRIKKLIFNF